MNGECFTALSRAEQTVKDRWVPQQRGRYGCDTAVGAEERRLGGVGHSGDLRGSAGERRALPWSRALLGISGGAGLGSLHSIADGRVLLGPGADKEGCFRSVAVGVA